MFRRSVKTLKKLKARSHEGLTTRTVKRRLGKDVFERLMCGRRVGFVLCGIRGRTQEVESLL